MTTTDRIDAAAALRLAEAYQQALGHSTAPLRVAAGQAGLSELRAEELLPLGVQLLTDRGDGYPQLFRAELDRIAALPPRYQPAPLTEAEQAEREAYNAAAAERRARGEVYGHELDDADLGETAATGWQEYSPGLRRES